jgi:hypothetical protein
VSLILRSLQTIICLPPRLLCVSRATMRSLRRARDGGYRRQRRRCARRRELVHARQQLRDDAALHLALRGLTLRRNRVDLVDEEDRRRRGRGICEHAAQLRLALACILMILFTSVFPRRAV